MGIDPGSMDWKSHRVGALPMVNAYLGKLGISEMLSERVESSGKFPASTSLLLILRNIILEREPIYTLSEWAALYSSPLLDMHPDQIGHVNDDRMGRALDLLYDSDRGTMMTQIAIRAIRDFHISMDEFHNDSTTITLSGEYHDADGTQKRGKESIEITHGHNKDHRPDLKQILWTLTVSSDYSVPVHYMAMDGNTADSDTHIAIWDSLVKLKGSPDFIYVADSKLCTRDNMKHISDREGRFITVLPATRSEGGWFREYVQSHDPQWRDAYTIRGRHGDIEYRVFDSPISSSEGYRIVWVWSSQKHDLDEKIRDSAIREAVSRLDHLHATLSRRRMKKSRVIRHADEAVAGIPYVEYTIEGTDHPIYRKSGRGRPTPDTRYTKIIETRYQVSWKIRTDLIGLDSRSDGTFPLITNLDMDAVDILRKYKYQPFLEKRHEQLKSVYNVAPVLFKNVERIESFLFLYFIAMLIQSLIERDLRMRMKQAGIESLPIYSEERECISPTAHRIFSQFEHVDEHRILVEGKEIRRFHSELSSVQKTILSLLDIPEEKFRPE